MRETTFENAVVGDRAWTPFGPEVAVGETNAKIARFDKNSEPALFVKSDAGGGFWHYLDGKQVGSGSQILFWSRPSITAPERPVRDEWVEVEVVPIRLGKEIGLRIVGWDSDKPDCGEPQTVKVKVER